VLSYKWFIYLDVGNSGPSCLHLCREIKCENTRETLQLSLTLHAYNHGIHVPNVHRVSAKRSSTYCFVSYTSLPQYICVHSNPETPLVPEHQLFVHRLLDILKINRQISYLLLVSKLAKCRKNNFVKFTMYSAKVI